MIVRKLCVSHWKLFICYPISFYINGHEPSIKLFVPPPPLLVSHNTPQTYEFWLTILCQSLNQRRLLWYPGMKRLAWLRFWLDRLGWHESMRAWNHKSPINSLETRHMVSHNFIDVAWCIGLPLPETNFDVLLIKPLRSDFDIFPNAHIFHS